MKIAFIHYHLKPGGVTTVLKHQLDAISGYGDGIIFCGEPPAKKWSAQVIPLKGLAYDGIYSEQQSPTQTARFIIDQIDSHWKDGCDLIHIHNPTLAKNKNFLKILKELQKSKIPLFLQIHDFAEDGRPHAYFHEPYLKNCHYGVINNRDYNLLLKSGLKSEGLHLIPNSVSIEKTNENPQSLDECVLYPVRAIRRKNIGEAILLSLFLKKNLPLRITLPPNSPVDKKSYKFWLEFSKKNQLNIEFEAGLKHGLSDLINSACWVLTTSIMEGFGFSFLESWLYGKPVWGRYLPGICSGFEQAGIQFPQFYKSIEIPLNWIGEDQYLACWLKTIQTVYQTYKLPVDEIHLHQESLKIKQKGKIDFGLLNEHMQMRVIKKLLEGPTYIDSLLDLNPFLGQVGDISDQPHTVISNAQLIEKEFSLNRYAIKLKEIYQKILNTSVHHHINKETLLRGFLVQHSFSLLKWGNYDE